MKFTTTNLLIKVYEHVLKDSLLDTLVYSAGYVHFRARLFVLSYDLKNRIAATFGLRGNFVMFDSLIW